MLKVGDVCEVTGGWIHFLKVGTLVQVTEVRTVKVKGEKEATVYDVVALNGDLAGLVQGTMPEDLKIINSIH